VKTIRHLLAVGLLLLAVGTTQAATIVIPLDLGDTRPAVSLSVDGAAPHLAVFDTAATATTVNLAFAKELGLTNEGPLRPPWDRHFAGGYQSTLRGATIGGYRVAPTPVPVGDSLLPDRAAVISPELFSGMLVTVDLSAAQLRVSEKTPDAIPQEAGFGYSSPPLAVPQVALRVGTHTYSAMLDTGSPIGLMFPLRLAKELPLRGELAQAGHAHALGRDVPIYRATIEGSVKIGPVTLTNPEIILSDAVPEPNIGAPILRGLIITMDPSEKRLWVKATGKRA
jgi:Aspartyl protease